MEDEEIVYLNIGGKKYVTTKTTLLSKGQNFFTPLITGNIKSHKDKDGAYFIDRNGTYFKPLLDYLRHGELLVPMNMQLEHILKEADFYSIDVVPGLCGQIKEGLYTSSNWILYIQRDHNRPWIFGITGAEDDRDRKNVFYKEVGKAVDSKIQWQYMGVRYELFSRNDKVYIWNPNSYDSENQVFFRCPNANKFPLEITEVLASDKAVHGQPLTLSFSITPKGIIQAKTEHPSPQVECLFYEIEVLCRRLLIMHISCDDTDKLGTSTEKASSFGSRRKGDWLLYLHSDLMFFSFDHKYLEFGSSFHRNTPRTIHHN